MSDWEMGLLDAKDWSAQWLAVEDALTKADRAAGLRWIWGKESESHGAARQFRYLFELPVASRGGQFFAAVKGLSLTVAGIWIDGQKVTYPQEASFPKGEWIELQPLAAGQHLIAIEVIEGLLKLPSDGSGLAFFARLALPDAASKFLRIGADSNWRTTAAATGDWYTIQHNDRAWEVARLVRSEGLEPWPARPAMCLRSEFRVEQRIVKARLYATALGAYEARLNGKRVGDALLTPETSQYQKRVLYRVYDVTSMLRVGENALGLIVGDGWYGSFDGRFAWGSPPLRVFAQLELTLADGSRQQVVTGPGWRCAQSPIMRSEIMFGEIYDARLEQLNWDNAHFDDSDWLVAEAAETPPCRLVAQTSPPIRATQILRPRSITQTRAGVYVVDFGQNFAGWCRFRVKGARGRRIELTFAELLTSSGEIDISSMGVELLRKVRPRKDIFFLRGDSSSEAFEPHFTYRGFRYVEFVGLPEAPEPESIDGVVVHTDLEFTGQFRAESSLLKAIWRNTVWTQRSNFVAIPTDCPTREQKGYMADAGIFWDSAAFNMDVCAFTSRQMDNVADTQAADGAFPQAAPLASSFLGSSFSQGTPPAWGDGGVILPWTSWRRYGDVGIIERNWDPMNRYLQFILSNNPQYIWKNKRGFDYGDWLAVGEPNPLLDPSLIRVTPTELIGTAYWAYSARLLSEMAHAIGRTDDVSRLRALFDRVRDAFIERFVRPDGTVGNGSQSSYVLALKFALLPEDLRQKAAERLAADINKHGVSLTTGIVGTQFILDVLADAGFTDLAYSLLLRTEDPSWGYMIRNGATTIWEEWDGKVKYKGKTANMSQNHFAFGSICGFLFRRIAGIDAATPGFEQIIVRPALDPRVRQGGGDYDSIVGRISTDWTQALDGSFTLDVTIPANATAHIYLPARRGSRIEEGRKEISRRPDMKVVSRFDTEAVVAVGSGTYRFLVDG